MSNKLMKQSQAMPIHSTWVNPLQNIENWFEDMEQRWMRPSGYLNPNLSGSLVLRAPHIDVIERDNEICVRAEMPGVDKDDLSVSLQDDTLTLQANMRREEVEEGGWYYRREMVHGGYQRTIQLPAPVTASDTRATFKNGILELIAVKKPGFQPTRIAIQ